MLLIGAAAGLYVTESLLSIWGNLQKRPTWVLAMLAISFILISLISLFLLLKLLFPKKKKKSPTKQTVASEDDLHQRINQAIDDGINVDNAKTEIDMLKQRKTSGEIYLSLFGEVNMGKSAIISAILPEATVASSNIAGTTQDISRYQWESPAGDKLVLSDVPGTEQINASQLSTLARAEALRAHIVIYVCDGDLTRTQHQELTLLYTFNKPTIIALNKSDIYSTEELTRIQEKLTSQLPKTNDVMIVNLSSQKEKHMIRIHADGTEENIIKPAVIDVSSLTQAIQSIIVHHASLDELRNNAVFALASAHLDEAEAKDQLSKANNLVSQYTKRAVVGALATVSPGTDLIVQAYLGTSMVRAICATYKIPVRDFDIDTLLKLIQAQVGKSTPVILAIIGNGLKAFPGIGTLAGGLVHATAYGLIFDALGKTLVKTLATQHEFRPAMTARIFQETLNENMEKSPTNIIKIVLDAKKTNEPTISSRTRASDITSEK